MHRSTHATPLPPPRPSHSINTPTALRDLSGACPQLIKWEDVEPFLAQFDKLDADGSGRLTESDLAQYVEELQAKAERRASVAGKRPSHLPIGERSPGEKSSSRPAERVAPIKEDQQDFGRAHLPPLPQQPPEWRCAVGTALPTHTSAGGMLQGGDGGLGRLNLARAAAPPPMGGRSPAAPAAGEPPKPPGTSTATYPQDPFPSVPPYSAASIYPGPSLEHPASHSRMPPAPVISSDASRQPAFSFQPRHAATGSRPSIDSDDGRSVAAGMPSAVALPHGSGFNPTT